MDRNWKLVRLRLKMRVLVVYLVFSCFGLCWSLNEEGLALLRLRERVVSDPFGALSNWNDKDGVVDACSWFGVECCDRKVVALNLKDLCLEGSLAPELRSLVHIKSIILRNNSFAGIIPEGLGKLKELEVLDLGYNNFSGPLPLDLGSNLSLTILLLDNNELLGSLPPEINELQMLSELQIDEKQLADAPKGSSGSKRFITSNFIRIEDTVQRRLLQDARLSDSSTFLPSPSASPSSESPSTSPPSESPSTFAAGSAAPLKEPAPNQIPTTPNVSSLPPPVPSPIPSSKSPGSSSKDNILAILAGLLGAAVLLLLVFGLCLFRSNAVSTVKPWRTGLSGQLQKVFVTGVPKLKRSELEAACEDFSNVIGSSPIGTVYKGTLSSGVEIAVASVAVSSGEDWSRNLEIQFRKKIDTLSKVNHKNFVNLLGYCEEEEPFTRMIVFEYAPNGTLFEHLHIKESEPLDWGMRLRIAMGMAYCLDHMHQLDPPIAHSNLTSSSVNLTEDFAAKISDYSFWNEIAAAEVETSGKKLSNAPLIHPESNVYSYGVLLFEMMTGRLPYSVDNGSLENWASEYLRGEQPLEEIVDPTLTSFDEEQLEEIEDVIRACVHSDPKHRPTMREVTARLRDITGISPDGAIPKLSPLWWAELEILSTEAM